MTFLVKLTDEAKQNYTQIKYYLTQEFGENVVRDFAQRLEHCFSLIGKNPHLFPIFDEKLDIRRAVLSKEVSIYYIIKESEVHILSIFDNRKAPRNFS